MLPEVPTTPKIRKMTVTHVRSERSPGARSFSGNNDKDDVNEITPSPPSKEERRRSSARDSDMDRYSRAREYEEVMGKHGFGR